MEFRSMEMFKYIWVVFFIIVKGILKLFHQDNAEFGVDILFAFWQGGYGHWKYKLCSLKVGFGEENNNLLNESLHYMLDEVVAVLSMAENISTGGLHSCAGDWVTLITQLLFQHVM